MAQTLCEIWAALAEKPDNKQAVAGARARVLELLEHVDDCPDYLLDFTFIHMHWSKKLPDRSAR